MQEYKVVIPLSPLQRFWYKRLIARCDSSALRALFDPVSQQVIIEEVNKATKESSTEDEPSTAETTKVISDSTSEGSGN